MSSRFPSSSMTRSRIPGGSCFRCYSHSGLARGKRGEARYSGQFPGGSIRVPGGLLCLVQLQLPLSPEASRLNRLTRAIVTRAFLFEMPKYVLSARSRPKCEQMVIIVRQDAAATDGDEALVTDFRKDHGPSPCIGLFP